MPPPRSLMPLVAPTAAPPSASSHEGSYIPPEPPHQPSKEAAAAAPPAKQVYTSPFHEFCLEQRPLLQTAPQSGPMSSNERKEREQLLGEFSPTVVLALDRVPAPAALSMALPSASSQPLTMILPFACRCTAPCLSQAPLARDHADGVLRVPFSSTYSRQALESTIRGGEGQVQGGVQAEVIEVRPLTRAKVAADWPFDVETVLSAVAHDAAAHAC